MKLKSLLCGCWEVRTNLKNMDTISDKVKTTAVCGTLLWKDMNYSTLVAKFFNFSCMSVRTFLPSLQWTQTHSLLQEIIAFVWKEFGLGSSVLSPHWIKGGLLTDGQRSFLELASSFYFSSLLDTQMSSANGEWAFMLYVPCVCVFGGGVKCAWPVMKSCFRIIAIHRIVTKYKRKMEDEY